MWTLANLSMLRQTNMLNMLNIGWTLACSSKQQCAEVQPHKAAGINLDFYFCLKVAKEIGDDLALIFFL